MIGCGLLTYFVFDLDKTGLEYFAQGVLYSEVFVGDAEGQ